MNTIQTIPWRVAVLGAGALGCAIGGVLAEAGHRVWLVNRNAAHVQAMQERGLILRDADVDRSVKVNAVRTAAEIGETMDLVIVLVKSFHTREVMASALNLLGPDTAVVSLQNGLGHEDILTELAGRERVLAGKTYVGGTMLAPGHVLVGTRGKETIVGELDGQLSERVQDIAAKFSAAGLQTTASTNILGTMWDKLFINVATGALSTLTRQTYGVMYQIPELEACAIAAVAEAMAVARASGAGRARVSGDRRRPLVFSAHSSCADRADRRLPRAALRGELRRCLRRAAQRPGVAAPRALRTGSAGRDARALVALLERVRR